MIQTLHLFPRIDALLIEVLSSLSPEEWNIKTVAKRWTVKDIAAHLLDGNIRGVSMGRDRYFGVDPGDISSYDKLLNFLNQLNHTWTDAYRRVSPALLISQLETTSKLYRDHLQSLNPQEDAIFSVAWAGEERSANWFHIAREYTEKFHHQMQIRHAVGREAPLYDNELYLPFLETSMMALPYHFSKLDVTCRGGLTICIEGIDRRWTIVNRSGQWFLSGDQFESEVLMPKQIAWKVFTKGISPTEAYQSCKSKGDEKLIVHFFSMLAVMA